MAHFQMFTCDTCGRQFSEFEFVETIEEFLCEECASGISADDVDEEFEDDGFEEGFDEVSDEP